MKYVFVTTILLLSLFACAKEETNDNNLDEKIVSTFDSTDLKTTKIEQELNDPLFLRYKFKKGDSFNYRMTVISQTEQSIESDTLIKNLYNQTITYLMNFSTIEIDENNIAEVMCNIKSVRLSAKANEEEYFYQSGTAMDSSDRVKFAEYESFLNNPFHLRVTPRGEIIEIFKADKIANTFLNIRGLTDSIRAEEKSVVKSDLIENILKPMMNQVIREVPEDRIAKDSLWIYDKRTIPVMTFQIDYTNLFKVDDIELLNTDKIVVIEGTVETNIQGKKIHSEQGVNYKFETPVPSAHGKIYFNYDRGLVQKSKSHSILETAYTQELQTPQGLNKRRIKEVVTNRNILELL